VYTITLLTILMLKLNNSLSQVIFVFLLFLGMVVYDSNVETKEKYKLPKKKKITTTFTTFYSYS